MKILVVRFKLNNKTMKKTMNLIYSIVKSMETVIQIYYMKKAEQVLNLFNAKFLI